MTYTVFLRCGIGASAKVKDLNTSRTNSPLSAQKGDEDRDVSQRPGGSCGRQEERIGGC